MPRFTRARTACLAAVAVVATLGVFVSTSAGHNSSSRSPLSTHRAAFKAQRTISSAGFTYRYSSVATLAAHKVIGGTIKCPSTAPHPISGIFNSNSPAVFPVQSFNNGTGWQTSLSNVGSTSAKVQIGTVCAA